jgi:serine/threonine-protein kinase
MATVWVARHTALDAPVAVKFLHPDPRDHERQAEHFLREARVAAAVRHRNVVDIIDFGTEGALPYMVMEFLEGESLAERLWRSPPLTVMELVEIIGHSLNGLAAVHNAGIIHRDLKPDNIFLVRDHDGVFPKILDFGISKTLEAEGGPRSPYTTREGFLAGTPHYMSPEQARGLKDMDRRTDIYTMGAILYEALTGYPPYDSENPGDLLMMIVAGDALPVVARRPDVGQPLSDVVGRAMAREREHRFETAREMRNALLEGAAQLAGPSLVPEGIRSDQPPMPSSPPQVPLGSIPPAPAVPSLSLPPPTRSSSSSLSTGERSGPFTHSGVVGKPNSSLPTLNVEIVDEAQSGGRRKVLTGFAVLALVGVTGFAVALGWQSSETASSPTVRPPSPPVQAPAPASTVISVLLSGVPEQAEVFVDGVRTAGPRLELPRNGDHAYAIEVRAPGSDPWRVFHHGVDDGGYDVRLAATAQAREAETETPAERERRRERRRRRALREGMGTMDPPTTLRDLDY